MFSHSTVNMAVGHWVNRAVTKGLMGARLIARPGPPIDGGV